MIMDLENRIVIREEMSGRIRSVAFIEYREEPENQKVITGMIESLPHLDPYLTGERLLRFIREKYPRPDWSMETEATICRPEYVAMIERGVAEGYNYYDFVGVVTNDRDTPLTTAELWLVLGSIDEEIENANN